MQEEGKLLTHFAVQFRFSLSEFSLWFFFHLLCPPHTEQPLTRANAGLCRRCRRRPGRVTKEGRKEGSEEEPAPQPLTGFWAGGKARTLPERAPNRGEGREGGRAVAADGGGGPEGRKRLPGSHVPGVWGAVEEPLPGV